MKKTLQIKTPRWALQLLTPNRYKGVHGGRGSGKSHFLAEMLIEEHVLNPQQNSVCIREIQRSLSQSVKKLLEDKIKGYAICLLDEREFPNCSCLILRADV